MCAVGSPQSLIPPKDRSWAEPSFYAIKRSNTGLGLFAVKPIPKGTRIVEYTGSLISNAEVEKRVGKYFFGINAKWSIDGSARSNIARYINHSCRPNAEALISGRRVWIWSKRNILSGQEITYHYGKEYFEGIIKPRGCRCEKCDSESNRTKRKTPESKTKQTKHTAPSTLGSSVSAPFRTQQKSPCIHA